MHLRSIRIRHYKSLTDIQFDEIPPLTVLVGCNGVGKSNIADTLRFLHDAVNDGLDHAVSKRGGISLMRQYSPTRPFRVLLDFCFEESIDGGGVLQSSYHLALSSLREGNFRVESEKASWHTDEPHFDRQKSEWSIPAKPQAHRFERDASGQLLVDGTSDSDRAIPADALALGARISTESFFGRLAAPITSFVSQFGFCSIYPNILTDPAHPDTDPVLKENGTNWASVIRALRKTRRGKQALEQIKEMMQVVMPQFEDINVRSVGGFLLPQFKVRDGNDGSAHFFDPSQISDGTLRILGILLALYQVAPRSLMVIEEPEQTVNPALLALLADAFREVCERTQLLITSHSPHLVDFFDPAQIRVVTMQNGETRLSRIRASQTEAVKEHLLSLEQLMSAEGLLPEEV